MFLNDHWTWDSNKYKLHNSYLKSYQILFTIHCHFRKALQLDILNTCILEIPKIKNEEVNRAEDEAICLLQSIIKGGRLSSSPRVPLSSTYLRSKQQRLSLLLGIFPSSLMKMFHLSQLFSWSLSRINQNSPKGQGKKQTRTTDQKQIHTVNELGYSSEFYSRENNICRKNSPVSTLPLNIMQKSNVSQLIHQMQDLNIPTFLCHFSNKSGVRITLINSLSFFGLDF